MSLSIVSVDPSLRSTGIAVVTMDPDEVQFDIQLSTLKSVKGDERLLVFRNQFVKIHQLCKENSSVLGIVEGYSFNSGGNAHTYTVEAGASCRLGITARGLPIVEMPPRLWKREVLKNGAASKKEIREKANQMTEPGKRPKNIVSRIFISNLSREQWSTPDELDALFIMIAFFNLLVKESTYFHGKTRASDELLKDIRDTFIATLKAFGLA